MTGLLKYSVLLQKCIENVDICCTVNLSVIVTT